LSFVTLLAALTLMVVFWRSILRKVGYHLGLNRSWKIWFISNLGRYVPGKVWQIMGMVYLCERENIPKIATTTSVVMAQAWSIISAFILMGGYLLVARSLALPRFPFLFILFIPVGFILIYPPILERLINGLLKRLKREPIRLHMTFGDSLGFLALYFFGWIVYGVAFSAFVFSVHAMPLSTVPAIVCIFAVSYTLGFLFIVTPGGLGVREGLLAALLSAYMPLPIATVISLLSRIWFTAGEMLCLGLALKR
ncbi:MAG: lysylphosphatidylglycerol synthase domain-containing protein, partial [bacterium]